MAAFVDDDLDALVSSGRLVVADYRQSLADLEPSNYPDGRKYAYRPAAWFGVPAASRRLMPIAILPDEAGALQYAPPAGTSSWAWSAAKTVVASADDNHHEIVSHLARTHLFVEPFIVATHLALADHHPVSLLLRPHFEGTIFINWSAIHFLVSSGGGVDKLQAGTIASDLKLAAESLTRTPFNEAVVPRGFAARGFGATVPFDYPYRDDALALWDAIREWVATYLAVFYRDDGAVQSDEALQRWSRLVRAQDGGRVATFPELRSTATLVDALAAIMYAASAMHAAGNFPQANITAYTPLAPGAGYVPVEEAIAVANEAEWLDMLPPLDMAALQLSLTYTLGSVHYTQLGRYDLPWFLPTRRNVEIQERLGSFHHALGSIEAAINARNARLPSRLPVSVPLAFTGPTEHQHLTSLAGSRSKSDVPAATRVVSASNRLERAERGACSRDPAGDQDHIRKTHTHAETLNNHRLSTQLSAKRCRCVGCRSLWSTSQRASPRGQQPNSQHFERSRDVSNNSVDSPAYSRTGAWRLCGRF